MFLHVVALALVEAPLDVGLLFAVQPFQLGAALVDALMGGAGGFGGLGALAVALGLGLVLLRAQAEERRQEGGGAGEDGEGFIQHTRHDAETT